MDAGDIRLGDTLDCKFTTIDSTGLPITMAGSPVVAAYPGNSTTEVTAGITLSVDFDSRTGLHNIRIVATSGNGYATGTDYALVMTAGTVSGVSVVGYVVGSFSIEKRSALMPTTAARTLDVTATGAGGIDWANVENPTTALNLSATNIDVDQVVASVSGAVGSVTGAVGSVTGAVGSVTGAVGSVTGNVGGNVTGSVGSVVGAVGSIAGQTLANLDATVSSRASAADLATVAGYLDTEIAAIKTKTDFLPSATAGAAGGLFIAGSNAATTVATWTSTGLTLYSDGVRIAAPATLNRPGFQITGNGSGEGVKVIGGATGSGIRTEGGATSGDGINAFGGVGGGSGATFTGLNGGHGIGLAGDTANFGIGMIASGYAGMWLQGTNGLHIQTNLTTETALFIQGGGDTPTGIVVTGGMKVTGPTAGDALTLVALAASGGAGFSAAGDGAGLDITAPDNDICTKALTVTTYAEPGQGVPPATTTLALKIGYTYKAWRNRTTQDATDYKLYADNATTVDQKATVGDDTVTFDRGEIGTGP